jgi:hypothetical protein
MGSDLKLQLSESLYRTLENRADRASMPLSEYVRKILATAAGRPTPAELEEAIDRRDHLNLAEPSEVVEGDIRGEAPES